MSKNLYTMCQKCWNQQNLWNLKNATQFEPKKSNILTTTGNKIP